MSALRDLFERETGHIIQPGEHVLQFPDGSYSVTRTERRTNEPHEHGEGQNECDWCDRGKPERRGKP